MATWAELAAERPGLAAAGEALFRAFTVAYLATVRWDGAPRVHPVTITLHDGGVFVSTIATTPKAADLRRDGRYALHAFPRLPDEAGWNDEEFMIGGRATLVTDAAVRAAVLAVHNDRVAPEDPLWHLGIDRAMHRRRVGGVPRIETWRAGRRDPGRSGGIVVDPMEPADWPAVRAIFEAGIATGIATLEARAPEWPAWDAAHRPDCRFVARDPSGEVVGWVALSPASSRRVYRGVAWESVYVAAEARGRGIGRALLEAVIAASETAGIWTLQAGIQVENVASLAAHERVGFRRIGVQEALGQDPAGRWCDIVLMERRSRAVGWPRG